ncbi:unnamed protein product [Rhodiola kirilowii]
MNIKKMDRFGDWSTEKYANSGTRFFELYSLYSRRIKLKLNQAMDTLCDTFENCYDWIKSFGSSTQQGKKSGPKISILDPQGAFLQKWNKIFVFCCVIGVSLDPLFLYIPVLDQKRNCLGLDRKLQIIVSSLRTATDLFYVVHMVFQFRTGFIAPSSRVFGRGELVDDVRAIVKRYSFYFIVDILAILPLPQIVILFIAPTLRTRASFVTKEILKLVILCQYVPRFLRIYPLYKEVKRTSGIFTETAWAGAALNLFLYMLASHLVGSFWYLFSIERKDTCWKKACSTQSGCEAENLYCFRDSAPNLFLDAACPLVENNGTMNSDFFDFGIFLDALQSGVLSTDDFPQKFFYCFWWGLRSLSSLGQNLKTSTFMWEICFAIFIAILGLVLFSLLIGNMQKYLESTSVRLEEMRLKRQDAEQWMSHRLLPEHLRERIRRYEQYKWQETRGVDEDYLVRGLPKDLRRDIKRHLCLKLLMRVPMFEKMDEQLLDAMCDRLKPVLFTEKSVIIREGDPVDEMLFIMRGNVETITTNGGRTGFFNSVSLKEGDFCNESLLTWALDPNSLSNLPTSTRTVKAITEVETFALMAEDLKFVASQYRRRLHSKQFQHIFKLHSQQWRTWAAFSIQAAWRRYCKRKAENALREKEDRFQRP